MNQGGNANGNGGNSNSKGGGELALGVFVGLAGLREVVRRMRAC
jgi:hypothetical protein